jgi:hypothetical protein
MTFRELTLLLIIILLTIPMKIKDPENLQYYDDYNFRLRTTLIKIYYFLMWFLIGLYLVTFILFFLNSFNIN